MGRVRKIPLPASRGGGSQYVREQFPKQVAACRGRHAKNLLIVITDADNLSATAREKTLHRELIQKHRDVIGAEEPVIILIPKWQVETWVKCLLGQSVLESDKNSDKPTVTAEEIKIASGTLHEWARPKASVGDTCVASLRSALPRWLRIG